MLEEEKPGRSKQTKFNDRAKNAIANVPSRNNAAAPKFKKFPEHGARASQNARNA